MLLPHWTPVLEILSSCLKYIILRENSISIELSPCYTLADNNPKAVGEELPQAPFQSPVAFTVALTTSYGSAEATIVPYDSSF